MVSAAGDPRVEAIWSAVLQHYNSTGGRSEARDVIAVDSILDHTPRGPNPQRVLLMPAASRRLVSANWLRSVLARRIVARVCPAESTGDCPDTVMTDFLILSIPQDSEPTVATVRVSNVTTNPAACRDTLGPSYGSSENFTYYTRLIAGAWQVEVDPMSLHGSSVCGHWPSAQQAIVDRRAREDSTVLARAFPLAGTYRLEVTDQAGDSASIYCRSAPGLNSVIRARRRADAGDNTVPIAGYYVKAVCGFSLDSLPRTRAWTSGTVDVYFAASVDPVFDSADSTVWRGETEAELAVWLLRKDKSFQDRLHQYLDDRTRDPDWYYMAGYWTRLPGQTVTFRWDSIRGGATLLTIRGEKVSGETLDTESH
jgi:hypothetical protein